MTKTLLPSALAAAMAAALLGWAVPTHASQALATARNCMACHGVANKLVGPSLRDVASRYQGRADAASLLAEKIAKGSAGAWGSLPMPAQPQVSAAEATTLAQWILEQR